MKILLICSESYSTSDSPLTKSVGSIVSAYRKHGADVLGFSPFFPKFEHENEYAEEGKSKEKLRGLEYSVLKKKDDETKGNLFIHFERYFGRDGIYGDNNERSYMDNHLRFSFLASAAMDYCVKMNFKPNAVHVHEWSGIAGALAKTIYREHFKNTPITLTIHNIHYDFHCDPSSIQDIGLPTEGFNADGYEFWGKVSMLKAAILYSDKVAFTSDGYLNHILSTDLPGGMKGFLESQLSKLIGIQNGIDYSVWNITKEIVNFKKEKKEEFKAELGLEANSSMLIYSHLNFYSYDSTQIISTILANLLHMNLQLAIGISEKDANYPYFAAIQKKNHSKMALLPLTEDDKCLHHRLVASDAFFSISIEDPSLSLLLKAAASGSIPISNRSTEQSFTFLKPFSEESKVCANSFISPGISPDLILELVRLAESIFCKDESLWHKLISNATSIKASWDETIKKYFTTFALNY